MSVLSRRIHELDTAPATTRHLARAVDVELRHLEEYSHTLACGSSAAGSGVRVFVDDEAGVTAAVIDGIERAGGAIVRVRAQDTALCVHVEETEVGRQ